MDSAVEVKPMLLLVDYDPKRLKLLRDILSTHFKLHTLAEPTRALAVIRQSKPDGIIIEIASSESSGLQLIRQLREDPELAATLIIVLSVLDSGADRVRGYEALADLCLTKPLIPDELIASVSGLLRIRRLVRKTPVLGSAPDFSSIQCEEDRRLLNRLDTLISSRLGDSALHVSALARACFTSERQLERKLHELLGVGPRDYLRKVRMEQARNWLENGKHSSICSVAGAVGYKNERSFQRAFHTVFGQNPSRLIRS